MHNDERRVGASERGEDLDVEAPSPPALDDNALHSSQAETTTAFGPSGMNVKGLIIVCLALFSSGLSITVLFPFLPFMVKSFDPDRPDTDIGYDVGLIGSAFMAGRCVGSVPWGEVSDRYGRKPTILIGLMVGCVGSIAFGMCHSLVTAVIVRAVSGLLNPIVSTAKAMVPDLCSTAAQPKAMSVVALAWGLGIVMGSAIGGLLSEPEKKWGSDVIAPGSLLSRHPYLLPNLLVFAVNAVTLVLAVVALPETLEGAQPCPQWLLTAWVHVRQRCGFTPCGSTSGSGWKGGGKQSAYAEFDDGDDDDGAAVEMTDVRTGAAAAATRTPTSSSSSSSSTGTPRDPTTWATLMGKCTPSIVVYSFHSLADIAFFDTFPLLAVAPLELGGLGLDSSMIGTCLMITGLAVLTVQLALFPRLAKLLGAVGVFRAATALCAPTILLLPYVAPLHDRRSLMMIPLLALLVVRQAASTIGFTAAFIMINNSVGAGQRGRVNGVAMAAGSFFKAVGPGMGGSLFAWSLTANVPLVDIRFAFALLAVIEVAVSLTTLALPKSLDGARASVPLSSGGRV